MIVASIDISTLRNTSKRSFLIYTQHFSRVILLSNNPFYFPLTPISSSFHSDFRTFKFKYTELFIPVSINKQMQLRFP